MGAVLHIGIGVRFLAQGKVESLARGEREGCTGKLNTTRRCRWCDFNPRGVGWSMIGKIVGKVHLVPVFGNVNLRRLVLQICHCGPIFTDGDRAHALQ